ncbi:MAG: DNRLRE domain-containing protein [Microbacterium sp.]
MLDKAIRPALAIYNATEGSSSYQAWVAETNNRNVVGNSGIGLAALAILDEDSSGDAQSALAKAMASLQNGLSGFAADGSYPEGPMYWEYASDYAVMFLNALQTATGSTHGLLEIGGLVRSGEFMLDMMTASGDTYTYSDSDTDIYPALGLSGLHRLANKPAYEAVAAAKEDSRRSAQRLVLRDPAVAPAAVPTAGRPSLSNYADSGVVTLRADDIDAGATFAALRYGGSPAAGHRQLDAGDFMISAGGTVWAEPLGLDRVQYASSGEDDALSKWSYYRYRAEGHNSLVLDRTNPDAYDTTATGSLQRSGSGADGSFAISDLSTIYGQSWLRGVRVASTNRQVVIQDEVTANAGTTTRWGMHTSAAVELIDGGSAAVLRIGDQRMLVQLATSTAARFKLTSATPSATSPNPDQESNSGVTKLFVDLPGGASATVAVTFTLLTQDASAQQAVPTTQALSAWSTSNPAAVTLSTIMIDGQQVTGFAASRRSYTVPRDPALGTPVVTATATSGATVPVVPIDGLPGSFLVVTSTNAAIRTGVVVSVRPAESVIAGAVASLTTRGSTGATYDQNQSTGWATTGTQNIVYELRGDIPLYQLRVLWTANQTRRTEFSVDVRSSTGSWQQISVGAYTDASGWMTLSFASPSTARYIRLNVNGDPGGDRVSVVREVQVFGYDPTPTPPDSDAPVLGEISLAMSNSSVDIGERTLVDVVGTGVTEDTQYELVSSAPAVAQIDGDGVIGVSAGSAYIGAVVSTDDWEVSGRSAEIAVGSAPSTVFQAVADTYVEGGTNASVNFGSSKRLDVKPVIPSTSADGTRVRTSLIGFDLSSIDPADVESATLVATGAIADSGTGDGERIDAYEVTGSWTESAATYQNKPALGALIGSAIVARTSGEVRMDVTEAIQRASAGSLSSFSIGLGGSTDYASVLMARLDSRESGSGPRIEVTLKQTTHGIDAATAVGTIRGSAANTHDGSSSTGWAASVDGTITWDLSNDSLIKTINIDWSTDASRLVRYRVLISRDDSQWFTLGDFEYRGSAGRAAIDLAHPTRAEHVRLVLLGGSGGSWQGIVREVGFVSPAPASVVRAAHVFASFSVAGPTDLDLNEVAQLTTTAVDLAGAAVAEATAAYSSSDAAVVEVASDGTMSGKSTGTATITVTVSQGPLSRTSTIDITVTDPSNFRRLASADTYVEGGTSASSVLGTSKRLDVKPSYPTSPSDGTRVRHTLIEFDLSDVTSTEVREAILSLQGSLIDDPQYLETTVSVRKVVGTWSEASTTYQNKPELGDEITSFVVTRTAAEHRIDLTSYLQSFPAGSIGKVSIALGGSVASASQALMTRFQSREAGDTVAPALDLKIGPAPVEIGVTAAQATSTLRGTVAATFDGNESSGWATTGDQSITWSLSRSTQLVSARLLWTANTTRRTKFELTGSSDGTTWVPLYDGEWTGASGWQDISITATAQVTQVRLTVHGDPTGDRQTVLREVKLTGY